MSVNQNKHANLDYMFALNLQCLLVCRGMFRFFHNLHNLNYTKGLKVLVTVLDHPVSQKMNPLDLMSLLPCLSGPSGQDMDPSVSMLLMSSGELRFTMPALSTPPNSSIIEQVKREGWAERIITVRTEPRVNDTNMTPLKFQSCIETQTLVYLEVLDMGQQLGPNP